jgi:hypothetical protein
VRDRAALERYRCENTEASEDRRRDINDIMSLIVQAHVCYPVNLADEEFGRLVQAPSVIC